MRLEWLDDILTVAQTGSFSEAAERRRLTQSAFSRRIRQIEDHVGVELFDRTHKPVHLRPTTERQRKQIEYIAGLLRQLVVDLQRGAQSTANRIVIVGQHALTSGLTPLIIKDLQGRSPNSFVRLRSANLDECLTQLLSRQADIAMLYRQPGTDHPVRPDFVETVVIGSDRLIPVIAAQQVGWLNQQLAAQELPMVAYPAQVFLGETMESTVLAELRQRLHLRINAETALTHAALEMAIAGFAVAWVPLSLARGRIDDGALRDLSDLLPGCDLEVTAVRLAGGEPEGLEQSVWEQIVHSQINGLGAADPG